MSARINNGGPAFPSHGSMGEVVQHGMSLRDYFAAKAMHAELITCGVPGEAADALVEASAAAGTTIEDHIAANAYAMADAMLKAREEGGAA